MLNIIKKYRRKINAYLKWIWIGSLEKFVLTEKLFLSLIFFFPNFFLSRKFLSNILLKKNLRKLFENGEFNVLINSCDENNFINKSIDIRKSKLDRTYSSFYNLYKNGFYKLENKYNLEDDLCKQFVNKSIHSFCFNSHIALESNIYKLPSNNNMYWSLKFQPWQQPFINKILNNDLILHLLNEYFDNNRYFIYSINTLISFPSLNLNSSVINYHRDHDDPEFLTLFIYWTETNKNNGSIQYIPGSHLSKININDFQKENHYLEASRGSMYFIDTFGLHCGNQRLSDTRVVTWIRFSKNRITNSSFYDGELQNVYLYQDLILN